MFAKFVLSMALEAFSIQQSTAKKLHSNCPTSCTALLKTDTDILGMQAPYIV